MSWITLTSDHVKARLAEDELVAIEDTGGGDGNRLAGIISQITSMVRAKVAACRDNTLGPAGTIPEECLHAATTIAKRDVRASLPNIGAEEESDIRRDELKDAMQFLTDVSRCRVAITDEQGAVSGRESGCYGGDAKHDF